MRGNGYDKVDLRIHRIDPLARDFWPFPADGLQTDEADAPPLPGNEPKKWTDASDADADAMNARLKALGSPAVSELVTLPIRRGGVAAKFGLDLKPLARRGSPARASPELISSGCARSTARHRDWMRVQVTDLTLSTVEETSRVKFAVTSLATAQPVADADIRLEGLRDEKFVTLVSGRTDNDGGFIWDATDRKNAEIKRIVVTQRSRHPRPRTRTPAPRNMRSRTGRSPKTPWLAWTVDEEADRSEKPRIALPCLHGAADLSAGRARAHQGLRALLSRRRAVLCGGRRHGRRDGTRQSGMARSRHARRDRQFLPSLRCADARDRRLSGEIRARPTEAAREGQGDEGRQRGRGRRGDVGSRQR